MPPVVLGGGLLLPVDVELEVELEVELDVDELFEDDPDVVLVVLIPPKLLDEELVETLPLDDEVLDTLPLDEVVDTLPDEVELVLEMPLDVETPLDVDTPLEVDTLPLDVDTPLEVETLPVDVETLPVEVETLPVEVEPLEVDVLVEAVKMALPLDPPKKPPLKKPPPKPPPKPPLPPLTMTGALPPPPTKPSEGGSGGSGIGAPGYVTVRVVTVCPGVFTTHAVRASLRTRLVRTRAVGRYVALLAVLTFAFAFLMMAGRAMGFSATWTAPPPMIAPPQVQAHNFAKAIFTDIRRTLFQAWKSVRKSL